MPNDMPISLKNISQRAMSNNLSIKDVNNLIEALKKTKSIQKKCDIAVSLSFVKNQPIIINPIIELLPFWQQSTYSGNIIITYSRLIVNYFNSYKQVFEKLLYDNDPIIRRIISHAFCFVVLADGVDNKKAVSLYKNKIRNILIKYLKKELNQNNKDFVVDFLKGHSNL